VTGRTGGGAVERPEPNSCVVHLPRRKPRLCLTKALREQLTLQELEAVLGHELAHIANRDALVMSVVGMPGWIMLNVRGGGPDGLLVAVIGLVSQASTLILSRYRELAADAGAANLTGRPSALASASASRALSISSALGISRALSISRA
jgi:heat shock protein HtpX